MTVLVLPRLTYITREDILADLEVNKQREGALCLEILRLSAQRASAIGAVFWKLDSLIKQKQQALDLCRELQTNIRTELGLQDDA